ncbi:hypothetical protein V6N13_049427 [Hibiscus sabdariffa]
MSSNAGAGIVLGMLGGILVLVLIGAIVLRLRVSESETDNGENETEKEREVVGYYQKQPPPPVKTAVDAEAVQEKQTIERLIKLVLDEKPTRFSSQLLQVFTLNYSTKLGQGGYGEISKHEIEWDKLFAIAVGAARGLEYLHHFSLKKIIHYDIKPANVLLDSNFCPKIADFGLAKLCNRGSTNITMSRVGGTPEYAAPEIWMPFRVSYKCDVYSFGVMLFEIMGRRNFVGESQEWFPKQVWETFDTGGLEEIWDNCEIEEKDREKAKTMKSMALWCVQYLAEARPSMRNVVKILEGGAEAAALPNQIILHSSIGSGSNSTTDYDVDDRNDTTTMRKYEIHYATSYNLHHSFFCFSILFKQGFLTCDYLSKTQEDITKQATSAILSLTNMTSNSNVSLMVMDETVFIYGKPTLSASTIHQLY